MTSNGLLVSGVNSWNMSFYPIFFASHFFFTRCNKFANHAALPTCCTKDLILEIFWFPPYILHVNCFQKLIWRIAFWNISTVLHVKHILERHFGNCKVFCTSCKLPLLIFCHDMTIPLPFFHSSSVVPLLLWWQSCLPHTLFCHWSCLSVISVIWWCCTDVCVIGLNVFMWLSIEVVLDAGFVVTDIGMLFVHLLPLSFLGVLLAHLPLILQ